MIVADRPLLGYPDTSVEIHMDFSGENYRVEIHDPVGVVDWPVETRAEAVDRFKHPFAFGYTYTAANFDLFGDVDDDGA